MVNSGPRGRFEQTVSSEVFYVRTHSYREIRIQYCNEKQIDVSHQVRGQVPTTLETTVGVGVVFGEE